MSEDTGEVLARFDKNKREVIRFTRKQFEGHDLIDTRVYFENENGALLPTKKGVTVKLELFPKLIAFGLRVCERLGLELPDLDDELD